jgi:hypothetical protein
MSDKPVSNAQAYHVRKIALDKGVGCSRFQYYALDNGMIDAMMDSLTVREPRNMMIPMIQLPTMNICTVDVELDKKSPWRQLVLGSCPSTDRNASALEDCDSCLPIVEGAMMDKIFLINSSTNNGWGRAFYLAKQLELDEVHPRWLYSLAKTRPKLHQDLGLRRLCVVATQGCLKEGFALAHSVSWESGDYVEATRNFTIAYEAREEFWFAFRKPIS